MADPKKGFDLTAVLSRVSNLDTGNSPFGYRLIALDLIEENSENEKLGFTMSDIEDLADSICLVGLLQPCSLVPSDNPEKPYRMEAGHRRLGAYKLNRARFPEDPRWKEIPSIVHRPGSSTLEKLGLILTNTTARKPTPAQEGELAETVKELLLQHQEETGEKLPGKLRDVVAQFTKIKATKLANLNVIRKNLIPPYMKQFNREKDPLNMSIALELARLPAEVQTKIHESGRSLWRADDVKQYGAHWKSLSKLKCVDGGCCGNQDAMFSEMLRPNNYSYMPCRSAKESQCCMSCSYRFGCKAACAFCHDEIQAAKAEKKAKRKIEIAQEKAEKEQRKQRTIALWKRFGEARKAAGVSQRDCWKAMGKHWGDWRAEEISSQENGTYAFKDTTDTPYSHCDPDGIAALAKRLNCSVDFLLCNTDTPMTADMVIAAHKDAPADDGNRQRVRWTNRGVTPPLNKPIMTFAMTNAGAVYRAAVWTGLHFEAPGKPGKVLSGLQYQSWLEFPPPTSGEEFEAEPSPLPTGQLVFNDWMPGGTNPATNGDVVAVFDLGKGLTKKMLCYWRDGRFEFLNGSKIDAEVIKWMALPPDEEDDA